MKSAKNKKSILPSLLLLLILLSLMLSAYGCGRVSFLSSEGEKTTQPTDSGQNTDTPTITPENTPQKPTFYNRYTGLACDESLLSCRPISVCIGNFDGNLQEGLSFADIVIEAPVDADKTRLWAMAVNPSSMQKISSVSSVRSYMMPISNAFGAISAYSGTTDTTGTNTAVFESDTLDYLYHNLSATFTKNDQGGIHTSGDALLLAAKNRDYSTTDTGIALPYVHAVAGTSHIPAGNRVQSIYFRYSLANEVSFAYDAQSGTYLRNQASLPHTDSLTGEQLSFSNVILLFHNVNYYHTSTGTTFSLDTESGGDGFCYTGGGVVPIRWHYASDGTMQFLDESGTLITLNRGKTYIGMLRVTDSTSLIAK